MIIRNYLSLAQIFGEQAFQDVNYLIIQKSSLSKLTPRSTNTAESLLVAILITALLNFEGIITDENNQVITANNQPITFDNSEAFKLLKMIVWKPFQINRNNHKWINHQIIVEGYERDAN